MELVDGPSLDKHLNQEGPLTSRAAVRLGLEIGDALSYLHAQEVSRIDLKPSNIILNPDRGAVVVDLGLARPLNEASLRLTTTGALIGTPSYMSPEQASSRTVDIRSDLYSLGVVMYQSLTGRLPHEASDIVRMITAILQEDIKLDDLPISPGLRTVMHTCLARDPANRYQKPDEFLTALRATPEAVDE